MRRLHWIGGGALALTASAAGAGELPPEFAETARRIVEAARADTTARGIGSWR